MASRLLFNPVIWFVLWALIGAALGARSATFRDVEYLIDSWETEDGLPENSALAMVQTPDGYLWFGTFNGLVRFDGARFRVFGPANTPELPSDGIVNLHLDQSGRLWASTLRGLAVRTGNQWRTVTKTTQSTSGLVRSFAEAGGVLCLTTWVGDIFRVEGERIIELPLPPAGKGNAYMGYVDPAGTIWAVNNQYYGSWDGQKWVSSSLTAVITNQCRGIGTGRDGSLLVVAGSSLYRIREGKIAGQLTLRQNPSLLWQIYEDSHTNAWLCSQDRGLFRVSPAGELRNFTMTNGLTENGIRFVFEDREKNLWVGSSGGGLLRMKRRTFVEENLSSFLPIRRVTAMVEESPGSILLGSYGKGVARLRDGTNVPVRAASGEKVSAYIESLLVDHSGNLWTGSYQGGVRKLDRNGEGRIMAAEETGCLDAAAMYEDSRGRIWVGGGKAVSRFAEGQWQVFTNLAGFSLAGVRCFAEEPETGVIWAGSAEGLFRYAVGDWSEMKDAAGRPLTQTLCLRVERDGTLWIGGSLVSLRRLRAGILKPVTEAQGWPGGTVCAMIDDGLGYWWLGSNRGIVRVAKGALEKAATNAGDKLSCQIFNLSDGLPSVECVGGFQATAMKDGEGRLWFATLKGLVRVDPQKVPLNTLPPPVFVERFQIRNEVGQQDFLPDGHSQPMVVPPGRHDITVFFSALSYSAPEKSSFAYRLEGVNENWVPLGNRNSVVFSAPSPGSYRLQIKAANNDGVWNETGTTLAFVVQPFVWQTWWFRLLTGVGVLAGASGTVWRLARTRLKQQIERLELDRKLQDERARLASVLEATSDFVAFTRADGGVFYMNRAGRRMLGIGDAEEVRKMNITECFPAWTRESLRREGAAGDPRAGTWSEEIALQQPRGGEIPVSAVMMAHRNAEGELDFISVIARDITDRKRAQETVQASNEMLHLVLNNIPQGVFWKDRQSRYRGCNAVVVRSFGLRDSASFLGKSDTDLLPVTPEQAEFFLRKDREVMESGRSQLGILEKARFADGSTRWLETNKIPYRDASGQVIGLLGTWQDITERLKQDRLALRSQRMEAIGSLAGGVAHDLNNALAPILMSVGMLREDYPRESEILNTVLISAQRGAAMVRHLLNFAKGVDGVRKPLQPLELIRELELLIKGSFPKNIRLVTECDPQTPVIPGNATQLHQVLMNLCVNARDAMPGGGTITIEVRPVAVDPGQAATVLNGKPGRYVLLRVTDTGTGIPPEILDQVFDPFFTTKAPDQGTGLGLSSVLAILKGHGGFVQVDSEPGKGATFTVYLPAPDAAGEGGKPPPKAGKFRGRGETILFVDDEASLRTVGCALLRWLGFNPVAATDGADALVRAEQYRAELRAILTDMSMPGMDGLAFVRAVRQVLPTIPIVAMSGRLDDAAVKELKTLGVSTRLDKPFTEDQLLEALKGLLGEKPTTAESFEEVSI